MLSWKPGISYAAVTSHVVNWVPFPVEKPIIWCRILDATSVERIQFFLCVYLLIYSSGNNTITVLSFGIIWKCRSGKSLFTIFLSVEEIRCSCSAMLSQSLFILRLWNKAQTVMQAQTLAEGTVAMLWFGSAEPVWTFSDNTFLLKTNNSWFSAFLLVQQCCLRT